KVESRVVARDSGVAGWFGFGYSWSLTSSSPRASASSGVGVVRRVKVCSAWPMRTVLRHRVPRSARRSVRVWAGYPLVVVALRASLGPGRSGRGGWRGRGGGGGGGGLVVCGGGAGGGLDGVGLGERRVVCEQQLGQARLELEGDVVGEHAEEHVRTDAGLEVMVDRADLDRVLHRSERALGHLELLVSADRGRRAECLGGQGGPDRVEAVQGGLLVDLIGLALIGERPVGDGQGEVLGDLVLVDDLAGALADLPGVSCAQSPAETLDAGLDLGEFDLGRG